MPGSTTGLRYWTPAPRSTFQWQLSGTIDLSPSADVFNVDLCDTPPSTVAALHRRGRHVICYVSVGSYEDWRPDAARFPRSVIGKPYQGWSGEWWLDVRHLSALAPLMRARLDLCQAKGFDAVEPDNIDGYQVDGGTGFPLTAGDQLRYNRWIAAEAHCRDLSIGLKNDSDMRTIGRNRTGESKAVPSPRSWLRRVAHAQSVRVDVVVPGTPCAGSSSRASGSSTVKTLPFPG